MELPAPLSQAAFAPAAFAESKMSNIGGKSVARWGWWMRSCGGVIQQVQVPQAIAATNSAARPTLWTTSALV